MRCTVRALANLRHYLPGGAEFHEVEEEEDVTVASLLEAWKIPASEVMRVTVGEHMVTGRYAVKEGDVVTLYPILAGG